MHLIHLAATIELGAVILRNQDPSVATYPLDMSATVYPSDLVSTLRPRRLADLYPVDNSSNLILTLRAGRKSKSETDPLGNETRSL